MQIAQPWPLKRMSRMRPSPRPAPPARRRRRTVARARVRGLGQRAEMRAARACGPSPRPGTGRALDRRGVGVHRNCLKAWPRRRSGVPPRRACVVERERGARGRAAAQVLESSGCAQCSPVRTAMPRASSSVPMSCGCAPSATKETMAVALLCSDSTCTPGRAARPAARGAQRRAVRADALAPDLIEKLGRGGQPTAPATLVCRLPGASAVRRTRPRRR